MEAVWEPELEPPDPEVPIEERRARLARGLARSVDDAEALAGVIDAAIADGLSSDLDEATRRLFELEPDSLRAIRLRVLVLVATFRTEEARDRLRDAMVSVPEHAVPLRELAEQLAARMGPPVPVARAVAAAPVAPPWAPRAELAGKVLAYGDVDAASEAYHRLLVAYDDPDLRAVIATQLAAARAFEPLVDLFASGYDPRRDGGLVGIRLAEAYLALGRRADGLALAGRLAEVLPAERAAELRRRFERLGVG